jgi:hypothetical protein
MNSLKSINDNFYRTSSNIIAQIKNYGTGKNGLELVKDISNISTYGAVVGSSLGLVGSFFVKSTQSCETGYFTNTFLRAVNGLKQIEIKTICFASPIILTVGCLALDVFFHGNNTNKKEMAKNAYDKMVNLIFIDKTNRHKFISVITLGVSSFFVINILKSIAWDISEHTVIKCISSCMMAHIISAILNPNRKDTSNLTKGLAVLFTVVYGLTDLIFLFNTSHFCHSGIEVLAGMGIAYGINKLVGKFTQQVQDKSVIPAPPRAPGVPAIVDLP